MVKRARIGCPKMREKFRSFVDNEEREMRKGGISVPEKPEIKAKIILKKGKKHD